jgi:hypothetical protein
MSSVKFLLLDYNLTPPQGLRYKDTSLKVTFSDKRKAHPSSAPYPLPQSLLQAGEKLLQCRSHLPRAETNLNPTCYRAFRCLVQAPDSRVDCRANGNFQRIINIPTSQLKLTAADIVSSGQENPGFVTDP